MKTVSPLHLEHLASSIPNYKSITNLPAAATFGVGKARVKGVIYVSNGTNWRKSNLPLT